MTLAHCEQGMPNKKEVLVCMHVSSAVKVWRVRQHLKQYSSDKPAQTSKIAASHSLCLLTACSHMELTHLNTEVLETI